MGREGWSATPAGKAGIEGLEKAGQVCVCLCVLGDCVCEGAGGSTNLAGKAGIEGLEKARQVCVCVCVC